MCNAKGKALQPLIIFCVITIFLNLQSSDFKFQTRPHQKIKEPRLPAQAPQSIVLEERKFVALEALDMPRRYYQDYRQHTSDGETHFMNNSYAAEFQSARCDCIVPRTRAVLSAHRQYRLAPNSVDYSSGSESGALLPLKYVNYLRGDACTSSQKI